MNANDRQEVREILAESLKLLSDDSGSALDIARIVERGPSGPGGKRCK